MGSADLDLLETQLIWGMDSHNDQHHQCLYWSLLILHLWKVRKHVKINKSFKVAENTTIQTHKHTLHQVRMVTCTGHVVEVDLRLWSWLHCYGKILRTLTEGGVSDAFHSSLSHVTDKSQSARASQFLFVQTKTEPWSLQTTTRPVAFPKGFLLILPPQKTSGHRV